MTLQGEWVPEDEHSTAAGRLSLTNYIGASVVMAALFHSWGLGWFGCVNSVEATLVALTLIILILLFSPWWSRPWCVTSISSLRVAVHLTGLPVRRAHQQASTSSP